MVLTEAAIAGIRWNDRNVPEFAIRVRDRAARHLVCDATQRVDQAAAAERERDLAELKSARESGVLVHGGAGTETAAAPSGAMVAEPSPATGDMAKLALDPSADPDAQQRKTDFVASRDKGGDVNPYWLTVAPSPYLLSAGSVIAASLITGLWSNLSGIVTAQITENAYESPTGTCPGQATS